MNKFFLLTSILMGFSCSHGAKDQSTLFDGVSIEKMAEDSFPLIDRKAGGDLSLLRGGAPVRVPVVSLFFAPALYQVLGYIPILRHFRQHKLRVSMVSGIGMGSLLASLYAKKMTPDLIEWKLTNLFSKLKKKNSHSQEWRLIIREFIQAEFGEGKIQHMSRYLVLPVREHGHVVYKNRGPIEITLVKNLEMSTRNPMGGDFMPFWELRKKGADIIFAFDIMRENVNFKRYNDYTYGIYSKAAGTMGKSDEVIGMNVKIGKLDSVSERQNLMADSDLWVKNKMSLFKKKISAWTLRQGAGEE